MSLREEIKELIAETQLQPSSNYNKETDDYLINKFLNLIETRIDELFQSNKNFHLGNLREASRSGGQLDEYYRGYMNGKFDILEEIKEMLK